jgi:hypothetical protein
MPSIPSPEVGDYQQQVDLSEPYRKITPQATPGNVGNALEQAGSTLGAFQQRQQAAVEAKTKADGAVDAANKMASTRALMQQYTDNAKQNGPDDGQGVTQTVSDQFDKVSKAMMDAASTNPYSKQALTVGLEQQRQELLHSTVAWEAQAGVNFRSDSVKKNVDAVAPLVEADPTQWQSAGAEQMHAIQNSNLPPESRLPLARYLDQTLSTAAARGMARLNPQGVLDSIDKPETAAAPIAALTPDAREQVRAFATGQLAKQNGDSIVNVFRTLGPDAGGKAYAAIDQSNLTDEQKDSVRQQVRSGLSTLNEQRRTQYANQVTALDTDIASGSPSPGAKANADALYHNYALDQQQYAAALTGLERAGKAAKGDSDRLAYATAAFNTMRPLDPKNPDEAKSVNLLFANMTNGAAPGSDAYANAAASVTDHVGVVPKDLVSWARASLSGGNAKEAAAAANVLSRIQQINPRAYGFAVDDPATRAMVSSINAPVQAGADPTATVNLARQNASLPKADVDALNAKWKASGAVGGQASALTSVLGSDPAYKPGWFSSVPKPPPLMQGQFDQLTQNYYKQTNGDLIQARELAAQDLKHTWGVSEVNGQRELMQYAPEAMFPGLSATVVRDDVAKTVADNADTFQKVDASKVRLTATDRTAHTGGTDWALSVPDKFGAYDVVRGKDGNPLTYRLPVGANDYNAVKQRQNDADLQKARVEQAIGRDAQEGQMRAIEEQGAL